MDGDQEALRIVIVDDDQLVRMALMGTPGTGSSPGT
jgi:hypothetical protein